MTYTGFILGIFTVFVATLCTLAYYSNIRHQHVLVTIATLISWFFSFIIVFVIPLDVSSTVYQQCLKDCLGCPPVHHNATTTPGYCVGCPCDPPPWTYLPPDVLPIFWKIVYWSSQILTWLVLPLMQAYSNAGAFTVAGKIKSAVIANLIWYGTYLAIFIIILIYVAAKSIPVDAESLKVIGATASNTWGLFLLVLLYGYGLVDTPRRLYINWNPAQKLQLICFKIAKIVTEHSESQERYEDTLEDVRRAAETIKYNHTFRPYIDQIVDKCPKEWAAKLRRNDDYVDYEPTQTGIPTEKALVKMHINIISAMRNYKRTELQKASLINQALELEDLIECRTNYTMVKLYWKKMIQPTLYLVLTITLSILSVIVVWSECTFFLEWPVLSIFAQFINLGKRNYAYISIELISVLAIAYLCVCAYSTVFKIRLFNYYHIAPNHQTDENSLLFSGALLCRLTPPLCLNFLSLVQLDTHITKKAGAVETAYTHIMGHMDVISFISSGFNIYFPIAILVFCLATIFKLGTRCLHCIGVEQFIGDDEMTQELMDEGRNHVSRERRKNDRDQARSTRQEEWNRMVNNTTASAQSAAALREQTPDSEAAGIRLNLVTGTAPTHYGAQSNPFMDEFTSDLEPVDYDSNKSKPSMSFKYDTGRKKPSNRLFDDL